jgi:hypothetical protein
VIIVPSMEHICGAEDSQHCIPCIADLLRMKIDRAFAAEDDES